jgi:hypothetical protein
MECKCSKISFLEGAEAKEYSVKHLQKIKSNKETWEVEYVCPVTGKNWLLDYPHSEYHGGGPPRLRSLPFKENQKQ